MSAPAASTERPPMITKASSYFFVCLGLFLLVAGITWTAMILFPGRASGTYQHVAHFTGQGDQIAGTFTVANEWEIRWEHDGHLLGIIWRDEAGNEDLLMEMPGKPIRYHGGIDRSQGGTFTIEVKGTGNWKIDIYQF